MVLDLGIALCYFHLLINSHSIIYLTVQHNINKDPCGE